MRFKAVFGNCLDGFASTAIDVVMSLVMVRCEFVDRSSSFGNNDPRNHTSSNQAPLAFRVCWRKLELHYRVLFVLVRVISWIVFLGSVRQRSTKSHEPTRNVGTPNQMSIQVFKQSLKASCVW